MTVQDTLLSATDTLASLSTALLNGTVKVVDCAAPLGPNTPLLKLPPELAVDTPKIEIHEISRYDEKGPFWAWNWLKLGEHSGTHFDAPQHWVTGKDYPDGTTDTIDAQAFVAPANVIDCSKQAAENSDFLLTAEGVKAWEAEHGEIGEGEWVLMRTDWDQYNTDEDKYLNANETGPHTPGPTVDCIEYLLSKKVLGWGTQCIGTDAGMAGAFEPPFPAHNLLHKNNRYGLASLVNLSQLPAKGAILIANPLKIERGTGSPIRALALVPAA
ncbi:Kynurenine formamidase [Pseudovibrio axinellae]|uniref:Kynurenine formamidase n=1 Tax=Pseudovibrio axinellae TaxID=989403 RepID=A0A165SZ10_9HYPH|nr:cyclase family protein [Pseudovibrio axinellae]KZL05048.1 Kynurenine formamidase [Pseudovibrio axinellae]SER65907.1 Kynurenine formamidase [Pseudovibrio axinellae]